VTNTQKWTLAGIVPAFALAIACGGSSNAPSPNPGGGGGSPGPVTATITIGANGAISPTTVTINNGESVRFTNSHNRPHQMNSDPHPTHTDCPPLATVAVIDPGQSATTNAMTTSRTCGFHDHLDDTNANLRGSIVVR
jgi:plastocyanin